MFVENACAIGNNNYHVRYLDDNNTKVLSIHVMQKTRKLDKTGRYAKISVDNDKYGPKMLEVKDVDPEVLQLAEKARDQCKGWWKDDIDRKAVDEFVKQEHCVRVRYSRGIMG